MKKPRQHNINDQASAILQAALAPWVITKAESDYGEDYWVKTTENEDVVGDDFTIQQKGTAKLKLVEGGRFATVSVPTKNLVHFLTACDMPVFLVVIDVRKKKGYWLFIQEYLENAIAEQAWKTRQSVSVRVPTANVLTNLEALRRAVQAARGYMNSRRPGSIIDAVTARKAHLEALDPRFRVDVGFRDGLESYVVHAREDVPFKFTLRVPNERAGIIEDLLHGGKLVTLSKGELNVEGLPILSDVKGGQVIAVQFRQDQRFAVSLAACKPSGEVLATLPQLTGKILADPDSRFDVQLVGSPLHMNGTIKPRPEGGGMVNINMTWDWRRWGAVELRCLPHRADLLDFVAALNTSQFLKASFYIDDNRVATQVSPTPWGDISALHALLELVNKAADTCLRRGCVARLPAAISDDDVREMIQVVGVSDGDVVALPPPKPPFTTTWSRARAEEMAEISRISPKPGYLNCRFPAFRLKLLDSLIDLGPVEGRLGKVRLVKVEPIDGERSVLSWELEPGAHLYVARRFPGDPESSAPQPAVG